MLFLLVSRLYTVSGELVQGLRAQVRELWRFAGGLASKRTDGGYGSSGGVGKESAMEASAVWEGC